MKQNVNDVLKFRQGREEGLEEKSILPIPSDELILEFERVYRVKLPDNYISFLKENNGVRSAVKSFTFDNDSYMVGRFLCLLGDEINEYEEGEYDIEVVMTRNDVIMCDDPDLIGANIIPILEMSGGNYICFDYRNNELMPEICIWFWDKSEKFKAFTKKLANSFDEFIAILNRQAMK